MNQEKILDALEHIDDDMIECVNVLRKYPERHKFLWLNYVAVVACVMLAIFGGFAFFGNEFEVSENSAASDASNQIQSEDDIIHFGDLLDKNKTDGYNSVQDESREELAGSTGGTSDGNTINGNTGTTGSSQDVCYHYKPAYVEILEINDNGFKARVIDDDKNRNDLEKNQTVTVVYDENIKLKDAESIKIGNKVYVYYGVDTDNSTQIIAYEITSKD